MKRSRAKKRASLQRQRDKEQELKELQANYKRLTTMTGGFSRTVYKGTLPKPIHPRQEEIVRARTKQNPNAHLLLEVSKKKLSPEMEAREKAAQQEAILLKARVGMVGNKMGLQYLTDSDLEDSRKGLTRRR